MAVLPWIQLAAALASAVAAVLLGRSLKARDLASRELTPLRIREFFQRSRGDLRAWCALLEAEAERRAPLLEGLEGEAWAQAEERLGRIGLELRRLHHQCDYPDLFLVRAPRVEPAAVDRLASDYEALCGLLGGRPDPRAASLARAVRADHAYALDQNTLFSDQVFLRGASQADGWERPDNGE